MSRFDLDCKACSDNQKIDRGCINDSPIPDRWQVGEYKFNRCPLSIVDNKSYWFIKAYNFMEKGILPRQGGWLDQSNKLMDAMNIITCQMAKISKEGKHGK